jgi:hypothetical protein
VRNQKAIPPRCRWGFTPNERRTALVTARGARRRPGRLRHSVVSGLPHESFPASHPLANEVRVFAVLLPDLQVAVRTKRSRHRLREILFSDRVVATADDDARVLGEKAAQMSARHAACLSQIFHALASSRKPPERARRARLAFPTPLRDDSAGRDRNPARSAAAAPTRRPRRCRTWRASPGRSADSSARAPPSSTRR